MSSRFDVPELTSAVQKYVRRGEVAKAARVARDLLALDAGVLLRRFPVLVAEDAGWAKCDGMAMCAELAWGARALDEADMRRVVMAVARLAAGPKDKDAEGLYGVVREADDADTWSPPARPGALRGALEAGDEQEVGRHVFCGLKAPNPAEAAFWADLEAVGVARGIADWERIVRAGRARVAAGGFRFVSDIDIIADVLALAVLRGGTFAPALTHDEVREVEGVLADPTPQQLDWYCLDMHTRIGKDVLTTLVETTLQGHPVLGDREMLSDFWFTYESAWVNGLVEQRWFDRSERWFQRTFGKSRAECEPWWLEARPHVKSLVEQLMGERGRV